MLVLDYTSEPIAAQETPETSASGAFATTLTGIQITGSPSFAEWQTEMENLRFSDSAMQWAQGDMLLWASDRFGENHAQQIDNVRYKVQRLDNIVSICKSFPANERRAAITFWNHAECTALKGEHRQHALDMIESGQWTRDDVRAYRREVKGDTGKPKLETVDVRIIGMKGENGKTTITIECDTPFGTIEAIKAYRKVAA